MLTNRRICIILNAWSEFLLLAKAEEVSFLQKYEFKLPQQLVLSSFKYDGQ